MAAVTICGDFGAQKNNLSITAINSLPLEEMAHQWLKPTPITAESHVAGKAKESGLRQVSKRQSMKDDIWHCNSQKKLTNVNLELFGSLLSSDFIFWAPKSLQMVTAAMKLKDAYSLEGKLWPT